MFGRLFRTGLGWALIGGIAIGAVGTVLFFNSRNLAFAAGGEPPPLSTAELDVLATLDGAVTKLTERLMPSVVHIRNPRGSEGSGVVYRADGWIVTNAHVVNGASTVKVTLNDGRQIDGQVRTDDMSDIALVKVDRTDLPAASFADSEVVKPGQLAIAIGAPLGFEQSVTFGHVSAVGRTTNNQQALYALGRPYFDMIQTDAAINPGNSGGPLMNSKGEVIGINTYIASNTGTNSGVGFSIQSNTAKVVADQLIASGKVVRGYLGVVPANMLGYEKEERKATGGAILRDVSSDGPAAKAGFKVGDIVTQINGRDIRGEMDFRNAMITNKPGMEVTVKVMRGGNPVTLKTKLIERPATPTTGRQPLPNTPNDEDQGLNIPFPFGQDQAPEPNDSPSVGGPARLGVQVRAQSDSELSASSIKGVYVVSVDSNSVAARIGIKPGMLITQIGATKISSPSELSDAMSKYKKGQSALITFGKVEGNSQTFMSITARF